MLRKDINTQKGNIIIIIIIINKQLEDVKTLKMGGLLKVVNKIRDMT